MARIGLPGVLSTDIMEEEEPSAEEKTEELAQDGDDVGEEGEAALEGEEEAGPGDQENQEPGDEENQGEGEKSPGEGVEEEPTPLVEELTDEPQEEGVDEALVVEDPVPVAPPATVLPDVPKENSWDHPVTSTLGKKKPYFPLYIYSLKRGLFCHFHRVLGG